MRPVFLMSAALAMAVSVIAALTGAAAAQPDATVFAETRGRMIGATVVCEGALARRAEACARHVLTNWPGGIEEAERTSSLEILDNAIEAGTQDIGNSRMFTCTDMAELLQDDPMWEACPIKP